jgi:hypothetical protein
MLEGVDLLGDTVLEDLEVRRRQVQHRLAVARRIHVDAHEVRAGSEGRWTLVSRLRRRRRRLRRGLRRRRLRQQAGTETQGDNDDEAEVRQAHLRS